VDPADISFAGPGKSDAELRQSVAAGILVNVESRAKSSARAGGAQPRLPARVAVRVNPGFELKTSGMKMGGGPKQFGVDAESVPACSPHRPRALAFEGFHIFGGSQNLNAAAICETQQKAVALAMRLAAARPRRCASSTSAAASASRISRR
jgi:diaminopimelate decarboxylase